MARSLYQYGVLYCSHVRGTTVTAKSNTREAVVVINPFETPPLEPSTKTKFHAACPFQVISIAFGASGAITLLYALGFSLSFGRLLINMAQYPGFAQLVLETPFYLSRILASLGLLYGSGISFSLATDFCWKGKWQVASLWLLGAQAAWICYISIKPDFTHLPHPL